MALWFPLARSLRHSPLSAPRVSMATHGALDGAQQGPNKVNQSGCARICKRCRQAGDVGDPQKERVWDSGPQRAAPRKCSPTLCTHCADLALTRSEHLLCA